MATAPNPWTDQRIEQIVGNLLRAGVLTAAAVVLIGAVLFLVQAGAEHPDYVKFRGEPAALESVVDIAKGAMRGEGSAVIQLGLALLLATPVARVAILVLAFALQRDRFYMLVSMVVLAVLLLSIVGI
jgi:uncharacterized membrane protein